MEPSPGWWGRFRRGPRLRTWCLVGTAAVVIGCTVLIVLAYGGTTFGLGTHDESALVTFAVAAGTLLLAVVAAALAIAAFWTASGRPDLTLVPTVNGGKPGAELVLLPNGKGAADDVVTTNASQLRIVVDLVNHSRYSARNVGVRVSLFGFAGGWPISGEWRRNVQVSGGAVFEFQWDGGADLLVHGRWSRRLPPLTLTDIALNDKESKHSIRFEYVADGVDPKTESIVVHRQQRNDTD